VDLSKIRFFWYEQNFSIARDQWRAFVNTAMNLRLPYFAWNMRSRLVNMEMNQRSELVISLRKHRK
jgi:hypothetical protein